MQATSVKRLRTFAWAILLLLAAAQGWIFRHEVSPDGVAYLDLSDAVVHGRLGELVNGYWSPVYPALIGVFRLVLAATPLGVPYWEFAIVHFVNVLAFALSLAAFEWFFRALNDASANWGQQPFATPGGRAIAYVLFGSASLVMISVGGTVPDYLLSAASFGAFACLLRLRDHPTDRGTAVRLGLVLAGGALTKSIMFPLGVVMLVTLGLTRLETRRVVLQSAAVFLVATLPWVLALSFSLKRPSIGETGSLNYAWYVNEQQPPNTGVMPALAAPSSPLPLRGVAVLPHARGTNPLWYDPARWHRDVRPRFSPSQQWTHLAISLRYYLGIMAPLLFVLLVIASAAEWRDVRATLERSMVVVLPSLAALGAYALVYATARYVAPFIVAASLALAAAFPKGARLHGSRLALAVSVLLLAIDALSPTRGRVFLTYGVAMSIPAWLLSRARSVRVRWFLLPVLTVALLWALASLPILLVRVVTLGVGVVLWFRLSRSADASNVVVSSLSLRQTLAVAGVVATVVPHMLGGWHAIRRWQHLSRSSANPDWAIAQQMIRDGTPAGSKIAVMGNPESSGWARLARYQIVAVVPDEQIGAFTRLSDSDRERVLRVFGEAGATRLIAVPR